MFYNIIVHSDYQGKGIGREIMNILMKKCKETNIRSYQLFSANGKMEFYHKLGFIAREKGSEGMDYNQF